MQVKLFLLSNNIITANIYNIVKAIKTLSSAGAACLSKAVELDGDDDDDDGDGDGDGEIVRSLQSVWQILQWEKTCEGGKQGRPNNLL